MKKIFDSIIDFVVNTVTMMSNLFGFNTSIKTVIPDTKQAVKKYLEDRNLENDETGRDPYVTLLYNLIKIWNLHVFALIIIGAFSIYLLYKYWIIIVILSYLLYEYNDRTKEKAAQKQTYDQQVKDNNYMNVNSIVFDASRKLKEFLPIVVPLTDAEIKCLQQYNNRGNITLMQFELMKKNSDQLEEETLLFAKHQLAKLLEDAQDAYDAKSRQPVCYYSPSLRLLHVVSIEDKGSFYMLTIAFVNNDETAKFVTDMSTKQASPSTSIDFSDRDF